MIKFLEDKNVKIFTLHRLTLGGGFLDITPKAQGTQEKIDEFNIIKIKIFVLQITLSRK